MRFEFATVSRVIFGPGTLKEIGGIAAQMGKSVLVVTGSQPERAAPLLEILDGQNIKATIYSATGEPSVDVAKTATRQAREAGCDFVIAFGGGAVIDTGKAVSALLTNPGEPLDYLEVIGAGKAIKNLAAPFIAVPTTAGTGSEVTSNAVLASPEHRVKVSLRSSLMLPRLALVDSNLTHSSPPDVTAQSGLDALTQVIEPFVSNKANPVTDALCREGIHRAARSLKRVYEDGNDAAAREDMALTSLLSGIALSNAKLGAVHGFAGVLGGMFDAPHGGICARLLPFVMETNIRALKARQPESDVLRRYDEIARLVTGRPDARAEDGVTWTSELCTALVIPSLGTYGVTEADYETLVEKAATSSSMQGNPIKLTGEEMREILIESQ